MVRSRNLTRRNLAAMMSIVVLLGCGSSSDGGTGDEPVEAERAALIRYSPMYSAFDGVRDYKLPVFLDQTVYAGTDPVVESSITWTVDSKYAAKEAFPEVKGAAMLTTKNAGQTTVTVNVTTESGRKLEDTATLQIADADDATWAAGESRYNNNVTINLGMFGGTGMGGMGGSPPADPTTGGPPDISMLIPRDASCANCHNNSSGITVEHTPLQTAGYSDDDLVNIFTQGAKPMDAVFNSPFLKNLPAQYQEMIYKQLHTWDIAAEVEKGIVFKLRSITPKVQEEVDLIRLRMGMGMGAPGQSEAAGSGG